MAVGMHIMQTMQAASCLGWSSLPLRPTSANQPTRISRRALLVSCSAVEASAPTAIKAVIIPPTAPISGKRKKLWENSQHVQHITVEDAEELYLSLTSRTNEGHVLMIVHAPWCPSCVGIEEQVEKLASGLQHEAGITFTALDADSAASRYFAKEVLGLQVLPSFVLFPKGSRTFFKYKGHGRDAESLLKFLNMVCNQAEDRVWTLGGVATGTAEGAGASKLPSVLGLSAPVAPEVVAAPTVSQGISPMLVGGGLFALAALAALRHTIFTGRNTPPVAEGEAELAAPSGTKEPKDLTVESEGSPVRNRNQLMQEIDGVVSRMGHLTVRLMGARVSLSVMREHLTVVQTASDGSTIPAEATTVVLPAPLAATPLIPPPAASRATPTLTPPAAVKPPTPPQPTTSPATPFPSRPTPPAAPPAATLSAAMLPQQSTHLAGLGLTGLDSLAQAEGPPSPGVRLGQPIPHPRALPLQPSSAPMHTAAYTEGSPEPRDDSPEPRDDSPGPREGSPEPRDDSPEPRAPAWGEQWAGRAMSPEEARRSPLPGQEEEMLLTGESFSVNQTVTADEVLRLLEQEGQDMDRVLQRLMALKGGMEALMSVDVNGHPTERK